MPQILGRFGRLRQTLSEDKIKLKPPDSQGTTVAFKTNQEMVATPSVTSEDFEQMSSILAWLSICLSEGHIEASQPCVGRVVGWPQRPIFKNTLYTDFECWGLKKNLSYKEVAKRKTFYAITDKIFISEGDKYHVPPLEECKKKFKPFVEDVYARNWPE